MYFSNLFKNFGMESCKPVSTPLAESLTLTKDGSSLVGSYAEKPKKQLEFRGLVGSIFYLAQTTRPDLAFSAHLPSTFLNLPGQAQGQAAKHVLRYVKSNPRSGTY